MTERQNDSMAVAGQLKSPLLYFFCLKNDSTTSFRMWKGGWWMWRVSGCGERVDVDSIISFCGWEGGGCGGRVDVEGE